MTTSEDEVWRFQHTLTYFFHPVSCETFFGETLEQFSFIGVRGSLTLYIHQSKQPYLKGDVALRDAKNVLKRATKQPGYKNNHQYNTKYGTPVHYFLL